MDDLLCFIKKLEEELYVVPRNDLAEGFNHGAKYFSQKVKKYIRNKAKMKGRYEVEWHDYTTGKITYHGLYEDVDSAIKSVSDWWEQNEDGHSIVDSWQEDDCTVIDYGAKNRFYRIRDLESPSDIP